MQWAVRSCLREKDLLACAGASQRGWRSCETRLDSATGGQEAYNQNAVAGRVLPRPTSFASLLEYRIFQTRERNSTQWTGASEMLEERRRKVDD